MSCIDNPAMPIKEHEIWRLNGVNPHDWLKLSHLLAQSARSGDTTALYRHASQETLDLLANILCTGHCGMMAIAQVIGSTRLRWLMEELAVAYRPTLLQDTLKTALEESYGLNTAGA